MKRAKKNKDKFIATLVDAELYRLVTEAAAKEQRSVSQYIRLLIERSLEKRST